MWGSPSLRRTILDETLTLRLGGTVPYCATPERTTKWARRAAYATAPPPLLVFGTWATGVLKMEEHTAMMLFVGFMCLWCVAAVSAILAHCHLAIAQAFAAGVQVGRQVPATPNMPGLRVVE